MNWGEIPRHLRLKISIFAGATFFVVAGNFSVIHAEVASVKSEKDNADLIDVDLGKGPGIDVGQAPDVSTTEKSVTIDTDTGPCCSILPSNIIFDLDSQRERPIQVQMAWLEKQLSKSDANDLAAIEGTLAGYCQSTCPQNAVAALRVVADLRADRILTDQQKQAWELQGVAFLAAIVGGAVGALATRVIGLPKGAAKLMPTRSSRFRARVDARRNRWR